VTFGSFNREFKVSQVTFDLWCRILEAVPDSRILMKSTAGSDAGTREYQLGEFARRGIGPERVQLVGFLSRQQDHLAQYGEVDIALDTFPYHGTTTTMDSLLMGVPVVTLTGYNHASRVGASLLARVGLDAYVARTKDEYVATAVTLAGDHARLATLRSNLRNRLLTSRLCDGRTFAGEFEQALQEMWRRWCSGRPGPITRGPPGSS
jgi:predicted O-linked N-acetylglucosamine transferase (SPINDLY family)